MILQFFLTFYRFSLKKKQFKKLPHLIDHVLALISEKIAKKDDKANSCFQQN